MGITPSNNAIYAALSELIYTRDLQDQAIDTSDLTNFGVRQILPESDLRPSEIIRLVPRLTLGQEIDRLN